MRPEILNGAPTHSTPLLRGVLLLELVSKVQASIALKFCKECVASTASAASQTLGY
jgi:hypothetical protein